MTHSSEKCQELMGLGKYLFFLIRKEQIPGSLTEHVNIKESKKAGLAKSQYCEGKPKQPSRTQWNQENLMMFSTSA